MKILLFIKSLVNSFEKTLRIIAFRNKYKGISYSKYSYFFKNILRANALKEHDVLFQEENNRLVANIPVNNQKVKLIIYSGNDLNLIDLVFVHRTYNFILSQPVNVMDLGMNIGDTCLFFASNPMVKKVYGYELCEPIYRIALENFSLNPQLSRKIEPYCYGIGDKKESIQISFHSDYLGANGIYESAGMHLFKNKGQLLNCQVESISQELSKMESEIPLLLKIDVEGSEYKILRELDRTKFFKPIKYLIMEYHFSHQDLLDILIRNGFEVNEIFSSRNENIDLGLIYAVKTS